MIDSEMAQVLCEITQIESLDLGWSDPPITNEQLTWLQKCTHLKELSLSENRDAGDDIVPALSEFTFLQTLHLGNTAISEQGVKTLRAALPNTDVRN